VVLLNLLTHFVKAIGDLLEDLHELRVELPAGLLGDELDSLIVGHRGFVDACRS